eukprot:scaffold123324_cov55-Phaeocystis_antarctica.AAC.5
MLALRHLLRRLVHVEVVVRAVLVRMARVDVRANDGLRRLRLVRPLHLLGRLGVRLALIGLRVRLLVGHLGSLFRLQVRLGHLARRLPHRKVVRLLLGVLASLLLRRRASARLPGSLPLLPLPHVLLHVVSRRLRLRRLLFGLHLLLHDALPSVHIVELRRRIGAGAQDAVAVDVDLAVVLVSHPLERVVARVLPVRHLLLVVTEAVGVLARVAAQVLAGRAGGALVVHEAALRERAVVALAVERVRRGEQRRQRRGLHDHG